MVFYIEFFNYESEERNRFYCSNFSELCRALLSLGGDETIEVKKVYSKENWESGNIKLEFEKK